MRKNKVLILKVFTLFLILTLTSLYISDCVTADEITIKSISPSKYYDSRPSIWGDYTVWRRAINQNGNEYIEISEPSWIMLHNEKTGDTTNITSKSVVFRDEVYHHAESPDIWDDKIIFEAQDSSNSYDTKLFMYNITSKDTWKIPIRSTEYAHGHLHLIYNDWIVYTDKYDSKRQAYLYNYESGIYRTIIGKSDNESVYGMEMSNDNIILTIINETGDFKIMIYDIASANSNMLEYGSNYSRIIATSIYDMKLGFSVYEKDKNTNLSAWNSYIYNIQEGRIVEEYKNTDSIIIWKENIAYRENGDIHLTINDNTQIIPSKYTQYIGDIHENTIVWMSNENSGILHGDARDNFDIYIRTVITTKEIVMTGTIGLVILIVIVVVIIVAKGSQTRRMS